MSDDNDMLSVNAVLAGSPTKFFWQAELAFDPERGRIWLTGEMEDDTADWFGQALTYLNDHATPPTVMLNTPGGSVQAMFAVHDWIRSSSQPVTIQAYGEVVSAGVLILACGHKRLVSESCVLMSHEPTVGEESELGLRAAKDRRAWEDWTHTFWCELMARYTPQDAGWWKRKTERKAEYWLLGGKEIVEAGLADGVA